MKRYIMAVLPLLLLASNCIQGSTGCSSPLVAGNLTVNGNIGSLGGCCTSVNTITGNQGDAVSPMLGNLNLLGTSGLQVVGDADAHTLTIQNNRWLTQYVVDADANSGSYQTIQSALDAAHQDVMQTGTGAYIFIRPGTYTENLTLHANMHLCASGNDGRVALVQVVGNHTYAQNGTCVLQNLAFTSTSGDMFTVDAPAASNTIFALKNCGFNNTGGRLANVNPSNSGGFAVFANVMCQPSDMTESRIVLNDNAILSLTDSTLMNSTSDPLISVNGANASTNIAQSSLNNVNGPIFNIGNAAASAIVINSNASSQNGSFVTFSAPGTVEAYNTILVCNDPSGNNVIGAGNYRYGNIVSVGSAHGIDAATTKMPGDWKPYATNGDNSNNTIRGTAGFDSAHFNVTDGYVSLVTAPNAVAGYTRVNADATPYAATDGDTFISVDSTNGPVQINLPDAPAALRTFVVKDALGTANTNPILITTASGSVFIDEPATVYALSNPYGTVELLFNGSSYETY